MSTYYSHHDPSDDDGSSEMRGGTCEGSSRDRRSATATLDMPDDTSSDSQCPDSLRFSHDKAFEDNRRGSYVIGILSAVMLFLFCAYCFGSSPQAFVVSAVLCAILLIVFSAVLENVVRKITDKISGTIRTERGRTFSPANCVALFGILAPVVVLQFAAVIHGREWFSIIKTHPIELMFYTLLLVCAPAANTAVFSLLSRDNLKRPRMLAALCGIAAGASISIGILGCCAFREFDLGRLVLVGSACLTALVTAIMLYARLMRRLSTLTSYKHPYEIAAGLGLLLSMVAIGWMEARPAAIRVAESFALATDSKTRRGGIAMLNALGAAPDILEEIRYQKTPITDENGVQFLMLRWDPVIFKPSLSLAFFRVFKEESESIYYRMTGLTPEGTIGIAPSGQESEAALRHKIAELSLSRSSLTGNLNSQTLSSYMDWTFELSNSGSTAQEGKLRLRLPENAVVSRVTTWIGGKPHEAQFSTVSNAQSAYSWVVRGRRDPVLVTQVGKDLVDICCYPVPALGTMQVRIGITAPVLPDTSRLAKMALPAVSDSNFDLTTCTNTLTMKSDADVTTDVLGRVETLNSRNGVVESDWALDGNMTLKVRHDSSDSQALNIAEDTRSGRRTYTVTRILQLPRKRPARVVVVLDGSASMQAHRQEIAKGLESLPTENAPPTSFILASDEDSQALASKDSIAQKVRMSPLTGGQLNERFLKQAVAQAGGDGCVLWIHGSQVAIDPDVAIASIEGEQSIKTRIYHLPVSRGSNSIVNGLKLDYLAVPIESIERTGVISADIANFCSQELAKSKEFKIIRDHANSVPAGFDVIPAGVASTQLATLWAHDEIERLSAQGNQSGAEAVGMLYRIVSKATSAVVLERQSDYTQWGMQEPDSANYSKNAGFSKAQRADLVKQVKSNATSQMLVFDAFAPTRGATGTQTQQYNSQAPQLQGATNGSVGPQGADATVVYGVNTAGTVRVNHMANFEAILNIMANALEILGLCWGVPNIILGVMRMGVVRDAAVRIAVGIGSVTFGLATPGIVNWLWMSANDLNLFS